MPKGSSLISREFLIVFRDLLSLEREAEVFSEVGLVNVVKSDGLVSLLNLLWGLGWEG